jgi:hypothetical protein
MEELLERIGDALEKVEAIQDGRQADIQQYQQLRQELTADILNALKNAPVQHTINPNDLATLILPSLMKGIPNQDQIRIDLKAATSAGASEIMANGTAAADRIRQAGDQAASRIEGAAVASQNMILGGLGFRSWRQAAILCFIPWVLASACAMGCWFEHKESVKSEQALKQFAEFVKKNDVKVYRKYLYRNQRP